MFVREELVALAQATKRREHFGLICSLLASLSSSSSSSSACHRLRLLSCSFRLGLSARYDVVIGRDPRPHAIDSFHDWSLRKVIPYGLPDTGGRFVKNPVQPGLSAAGLGGIVSAVPLRELEVSAATDCILRSTFAPLSGSTRSSARPVSMWSFTLDGDNTKSPKSYIRSPKKGGGYRYRLKNTS